MTLDEAIKHAEDVADKKESEKQKWDKWLEHDNDHRAVAEMASCESCAEEHRQLADWLRELKWLREQASVLNKIRAEILENAFSVVNPKNTYEYINVLDLGSIEKIINKYRAESEDKA